jgi:hypothetical protein
MVRHSSCRLSTMLCSSDIAIHNEVNLLEVLVWD